jgi:hypothetical protein
MIKDFAYGTAFKTQTCIQARSAWISFPASLVAFTIFFLGATMWRTRKHGRSKSYKGAWKSSSLPVLFAGLDEEVMQKYKVVGTKNEMTKAAENLKVSLVHTEVGWRLRGDHGD